MSNRLFVQIDRDHVISSVGQISRSTTPSSTSLSFYAPDFFLKDPTPWFIPEATKSSPIAQIMERNLDKSSEHILWEQLDEKGFQEVFKASFKLVSDDSVQKIVPVLFQKGTLPQSWDKKVLEHLLINLARGLAPNLFSYGLSFSDFGMVGLTPEYLFELKENTLVTAALAGTAPIDEKDLLLKNPKEKREHSLVIDDIRSKLGSYGDISIGETSLYEIGSMAHLKTPISIKLNKKLDFEEVVHLLHPTAALGAYPTNHASQSFFSDQNTHTPRNRFGAPLGIRYPNGEGICLVAIRALQWEGMECSIGAGVGIVSESVLQNEWNEILLKIQSIQKLFL